MYTLSELISSGPKFAVLIDPDHEGDTRFDLLMMHLAKGYGDMILVGGSTSRLDNITSVIGKIRKACPLPIFLFPGTALQLCSDVDGILLPMLISGRNPDFLIGRHVEYARLIQSTGAPVFSTGYILIDGGKTSTTALITQTSPIPSVQIDYIVRTALAGSFLGMQSIYLESGSGAAHHAQRPLIEAVRAEISIPLLVGGGIKDRAAVYDVLSAGADVVVVGTQIENHPDELVDLYHSFLSVI